jgi:hypothetical protein
MRFSLLPEVFEGLCDLLKGFFPGDGLPAALAPLAHPFQRRLDAIGVIEPVESSNPFGTKSSPIDRMERVSSDIDRPSIDDPDQDATTP